MRRGLEEEEEDRKEVEKASDGQRYPLPLRYSRSFVGEERSSGSRKNQ